ncbi:MAG: hypothetical protein U5Q03_08170 [Bacteroidota bacterium]|nr:hypothetical protein [Bacteroidota bacterium]
MILHNSPEMSLGQVDSLFNPEHIIITGANTYYHSKGWHEDTASAGAKLIDAGEQAWLFYPD